MKERRLPLTLAALFLILGSFVADLPGIQTDEALFASVQFNPKVESVTVRLLFGNVPAMCFPYIGTLKSGLYWVLWHFVDPSAVTVHFLCVVLGALSIYVFARLLQRLDQPPWAAIWLATDATYLMTLRSDWGPVALQHLLGISGVYAGVRYAQTMQWRWVAAAGFLFGLGFWDKITFLWILVAIGAGVLVTARHLIRPLPVAILTLFFALGCYPLLVFNWKTQGSSFAERAQLETGSIREKAALAWRSLGDVNIFGVGTSHALPPVPPANPVAAALCRIDRTFPILPWVFAVSILAAPWLIRSAFYRFYLVALLAGYGYMFALKNAGGGIHHVVLLWPLPHLLAASLPLRSWMVIAVTATNLLQVNHYYAQFLRREVSVEWSDATAALAARLEGDSRTYRILDWGIYDCLHLLTRGRNDLYIGAAPKGEAARYISHVPELVMLPIDADKGLRLVPEETIADSAGRPVFVISRSAAIERK